MEMNKDDEKQEKVESIRRVGRARKKRKQEARDQDPTAHATGGLNRDDVLGAPIPEGTPDMTERSHASTITTGNRIDKTDTREEKKSQERSEPEKK